jgi:hypothetical protein
MKTPIEPVLETSPGGGKRCCRLFDRKSRPTTGITLASLTIRRKSKEENEPGWVNLQVTRLKAKGLRRNSFP